MLTRRTLIENTLKISAGFALTPRAVSFGDESVLLTLKLGNAAPVSIPANFTGLGYEMSSVAAPGLLSTTNSRYVDLIKGLGSEGVLRAGGIVANYTRYEPNGIISAERKNTVITRARLGQFAAFLKRIGWTAIWSVNFAQGSIEAAVEEARAVADVLGSRLLALEIGNEVDSYSKGQPFRSSSYDYETYRKEYTEWHAAILKAVPHIRFAAPDTAKSVEWVERMAQDEKGDVQLLTTHYYRNDQKRGTSEQLLVPDPRLHNILERLRTASERSGIPWRMCETNSFSGGGRPGVSDTFIGALWTLDYMLLLATYGCSGVNIETGTNQLGFTSSYSPIQEDGKGLNTAGVPYYGMLAFAAALTEGRQILPIDLDNHGMNLTAYVLGTAGKPRCAVVVNKDSSHDAHVSIAELGMGEVSALRLLSPTPDSTAGVTFAGSAVNTEGRWSANSKERIRDGNVAVPHMSAVVLRSANQRDRGVRHSAG
ncbi:MAG TPA: glycosyl hydrolase family 79 C-terminal domain-containing protein [Candidatus Sulfotelmatobacter sp.]|nr:glycosyl hydrolase family 79 C-terminal domain-containing protein [Candidatus Sulfotelmatobacter sp.]